MEKFYEGTCYIGVVGSELDYGICRDSIQKIKRREDDEGPRFTRATKGYEARQTHINKFIESDHDFILLLDGDMTFPEDTLEKLRSHGKPYVSGLYFRRQYDPIAPIWFENNFDWPTTPYFHTIPEEGLIEIGASGWGCILIHRDVVLDVREEIKGEWEVLEDDMDIWPYDLDKVVGAIRELDFATSIDGVDVVEVDDIRRHIKTLTEEIRPLRGTKSPVGSDVRFPFFAKEAGYQLYGDPSVSCGHIVNYPISQKDFSLFPEEKVDEVQDILKERINKGREEIRSNLKSLGANYV